MGQPLLEEKRAGPSFPVGHRDAGRIAEAFFLAGILVALTLGASWGALLLGRIGSSASFTALSAHEVNAHGHAQVFGWVGLFVMGFAYRFLPEWKGVAIRGTRLAYASLGLMLLGIALRSVLEPVAHGSAAARYAALGGSLAEMAATAIFVGWMLAVYRRTSQRFALYDGYLAAAIGWFVLQVAWDALYFRATSIVEGREQLLGLIATWQAPLREIQIFGFAMLMVVGMSLRLFADSYGFRAPRARWGLSALAAINLGILGMVGGFILMGLAGHRWAALWYSAVLVLAAATAAVVREVGILSAAVRRDRSLKFFRAAYLWLLASLVMLVFLPGHQFGLLHWLAPESRASQIGFSHAYYGAIRHAVTVGFISQMVVGLAPTALTSLRGVEEARRSALWAPLVLLNAGCLLRVSGQVLSDFQTGAFAWLAVSGVLEVTALALWGAHIAGLVLRRAAFAGEHEGHRRPDEDAASCVAGHAVSG